MTTLSPAMLGRVHGINWKRDPGSFAYCLTHKRIPPIGSLGGQRWRNYRHTPFLVERFRKIATTPGHREIWNLPPRYGKSLVASVFGPAWFLDLWPNKRVMVTTYAKELGLQFGRDVRNIIEEYPDELRVSLRQDSRAAGRWNTPQGGGLLATGIDGGATGFGADLLVIDDPFKNREEAESDAQREHVWNEWIQTYRTRLEPGASVLVVMTRWHEDDLTGRLLESDREGTGDGWHLVRIPEIAEELGDFLHPVTHEPMPDVLDREPGDVIDEERFTVEEVRKKHRGAGPYVAAGMYQQRPSASEGGIFKRRWWRYWQALPAFERFDYWLQSWDMAFKDADDSSFVVGQLWGRCEGEFYLVDQVRDRLDFVTTVNTVVRFRAKHRYTNVTLIEDKANGPAVINVLRRRVPGILPYPVKGSKEARAQSVAPTIAAGNVLIPSADEEFAPWVHDYVEELANFPKAAHDDQVDATSQALDWLTGLPIASPGGDGDQLPDDRLDGRR